jgi:NADH:ubiquinone oxidoreductase subunit 5 (subunit L)/multisubunit Na+/H+ antiporter MnhA subunit
MDTLLQFFILIPLAGLLINLLLPRHQERAISGSALLTVVLHFASLIAFTLLWTAKGHPQVNLKEVVLFKMKDYEFLIALYFDKITATYLLTSALLTSMVCYFSRFYMHREGGYKRFFNTILFFYSGLNIALLAGNFETLFVGWEVIGLSSFLLVAFYRDRYLPVRNAVKVFAACRIGDVGLLLATWASHHLWHENVTFMKMSNSLLVHQHLSHQSLEGAFIALMIVLAASVKSAQLPFSSWLPRAMEGPTPSSAIFYGALSVHLGVFLLLRTYPFWEAQTAVRVIIGALGLLTSIVGLTIARVQPTIKSQIAYYSIAHIGLMFLEVALGLTDLALVHFALNALVRMYQLLVSPSVVSYKIREQFYTYIAPNPSSPNPARQKLMNTLYMWSLKEWNLEAVMNTIVWKPLNMVGKALDFLTIPRLLVGCLPLALLGGIALTMGEAGNPWLHTYLPSAFSLLGLVFVLKSFSERRDPLISWILLVLNHCWVAMAISYNEHFSSGELLFYLSGVAAGGALGLFCLLKLRKKEHTIDLEHFYGYHHEHPRLSIIFFLACLALAGFPATPTFIGIDLVFNHIHENQWVLAYAVASSFILGGISIIRLYTRLFLGPHIVRHQSSVYPSV